MVIERNKNVSMKIGYMYVIVLHRTVKMDNGDKNGTDINGFAYFFATRITYVAQRLKRIVLLKRKIVRKSSCYITLIDSKLANGSHPRATEHDKSYSNRAA